MARKKKGELPSGNIRKQVFMGYETVVNTDGTVKKKRIYQSITAPTKKEAEYQAALLKMERQNVTKCSNRMTFRQAREKYLEDKKHVLSASTIRGYSQMKTYYQELDDLMLSSLTNDVIQTWINRFASTHSVKTTLNAYGLLSAVCGEHEITFKITKPRKEIKQTYVPSDQDVEALIRYFKEKPDKDMVIAICLAAFGTMRRSEICGATAEDVNGCTLHVRHAVVLDMDGEAIRQDRTKNSTSDRFIEFPKFVIDILPKEGPLVRLEPDMITSRFGRGLKKTGIPHFRFHDLRHYSASIMHAIGIPDVYIMDRGGWKTDYTLKQIYRGTIEDYKRQFVKQTNQYFESMQHDLQHEN